MMTSPSTIFLLWNGQAALCGGTLAECIAVARRDGLLTHMNDGDYKLAAEADLISYSAAEGFRFFSAAEVGTAKVKA